MNNLISLTNEELLDLALEQVIIKPIGEAYPEVALTNLINDDGRLEGIIESILVDGAIVSNTEHVIVTYLFNTAFDGNAFVDRIRKLTQKVRIMIGRNLKK